MVGTERRDGYSCDTYFDLISGQFFSATYCGYIETGERRQTRREELEMKKTDEAPLEDDAKMSSLERMESKDSKAESGPSSPSGPKEPKDAIVKLVMGFATSSDFEKAFELFAEENKNTFVPSMFELGPNDEHPMVWHECYLDYLKTFEGKIERFIEGSGFKINDYYDQARDILEDEEVYGESKFFLEALLATSEYEYFIFILKTTLAELGYNPATTSEKAEEKE